MFNELRITPSILNADHSGLNAEIAKIAKDSDLIHLDIMDNLFVPNLTWDFAAAEKIIADCPIPVDAHLMINDVDRIALDYARAGAGSVTIHIEAAENPAQTLKSLRKLGSRAGMALKPGTEIELYSDLLDEIDMLLIMTVEPGFGGQKFMASMMDKVRRSKALIGDRPIWIQVDGGVSMETIAIAREAGADTFVAGSAVFNSPDPAGMVKMLRHRASEV
ncbi:MAG: ribulose-phosphate 3-epimerase [Actinobacteria bacterium]|nr:ribulose-phosphate 3-epimerase [Actinomycetota bacterium]